MVSTPGLVPDPVVERRKPIAHPTANPQPPASEGCDGLSVPTSSSQHTRMSSLTLLSSGEFCNITGRLDRSSVSSSPLDDVERGLDIRGTEKGGQVLCFKSLIKVKFEFNNVLSQFSIVGKVGIEGRINAYLLLPLLILLSLVYSVLLLKIELDVKSRCVNM